MQYFSNGHERNVFRDKAKAQLGWYQQKVHSYQELLLVEPRKFNFNDYMMYVRECRVLEDYVSALDAEDVAAGELGHRELPADIPHTNVQRELVLSSVVVDLMGRLSSIRDAMSYLDASGVIGQDSDMGVRELLSDIRAACRDDGSDVMGAVRADGYGYKVVPEKTPMMPEWGVVSGNRDLLELICMMYDINYNIASVQDRLVIEGEARKWYKGIRRAFV